MAFVSLFNVITQDMWPADPPHALHVAEGEIAAGSWLTNKLKVGMGRWARVRVNDRGPHRTLETGCHQSCDGKGQGHEVPWGQLTPHITDEVPGPPKANVFLSHTESRLELRCPNARPTAHSVGHPHRSPGRALGLVQGVWSSALCLLVGLIELSLGDRVRLHLWEDPGLVREAVLKVGNFRLMRETQPCPQKALSLMATQANTDSQAYK